MNFDDIDYFAALWKHQHVGRAAQSLGLTQPALSRALARFEARLGLPLFDRTAKGLVPTTAGNAFARRILRVRTESGDAIGELDQMRSGRLGALRIGYSPSIDEGFVLAACRRLASERPAARLTIVPRLMQDLASLLAGGALDVIVAPVPEPALTELAVTVLHEDRLRILADRRHPLLRKPQVTLVDVASESWVLQPVQFQVRRELDQCIVNAGLPPLRIRIESEMAALGRLALLVGTRFLTLHSSRDRTTFTRLGLRELDVADLALDRRIALMRRRGGYVSPLSERFGQLLRE
ncbi:MAG: LysR family transcriptional regulator [Burkholderiales bacterium]|nr:LysR family transcriptional regulator [Burkholderiales bacterium]